MRAFQRFFHCAGVKMTYSEGFNPHQKMHFALPLGVGITSIAEYLDAEIADGQNPDLIRERLNAICGDGFEILAVRELEENAQKAMAAVRYSLSRITFDEPFPMDLDAYLQQEEILISKKTKSGIREVNVKELLVRMEWTGNALEILMKTGTENSIKPELIAEDLMNYLHLDYVRDQIRIEREELYAEGLVPLMDYQTI